jgi:outer membrane lipoprotein carrier protein
MSTNVIKPMKKLLLAIIGLAVCTTTFAQEYTKAADSDPQAKAILDQVSKKYNNLKSLEAAFTLEIELPEQPKEVQEGKMLRQGDKYAVDMGMTKVISDGQAIYVVMKNQQSVQINDIPDESETGGLSLSPEAMFNFYEKGQFVYVLANEYMDGKIPLQQIEFKPLDRGADYSKLRMEVNKKTKEVVRLIAFSKDGSRFTITVNGLKTNKSLASALFTFNEKDYPDYYIEDLRE